MFFNALETPGGEVRLEIETNGESRLTVDLDELSLPGVRVVVGASLAGDRTFGELGPVELTLRHWTALRGHGPSWTPGRPKTVWCWRISINAAAGGVSAPSARATRNHWPASPSATGWTLPNNPLPLPAMSADGGPEAFRSLAPEGSPPTCHVTAWRSQATGQ